VGFDKSSMPQWLAGSLDKAMKPSDGSDGSGPWMMIGATGDYGAI
jgi:hypothetical protein